MREEDNIAIACRMYTDVFDHQNLDLADTVVAPNFTPHRQGCRTVLRASRPSSRCCSPRFRTTDTTSRTYSPRATVWRHESATTALTWVRSWGIAPSGKHVSQAELHIVRLERVQWVEHWGVRDDIGFLRQMQSAEPQPTAP